jgi:hypothetical protein
MKDPFEGVDFRGDVPYRNVSWEELRERETKEAKRLRKRKAVIAKKLKRMFKNEKRID